MTPIHAAQSLKGCVTAPHHLAAQSGLRVLQEGGNAIEAMVAAAASIAVVYPHMNSLGGDAFWLISQPGKEPIAIDACGGAAMNATRDFYANQGHQRIPDRGPLAALTVAGTIAGWELALKIARNAGGSMPLSRLFEDAISYAGDGVTITGSQASAVGAKADELSSVPGFSNAFLKDGRVPASGDIQRFPRLRATFERLAYAGLQDFYHGDLARCMSSDLEGLGSPLRIEDFEAYQARIVPPLQLETGGTRLFNFPPPTQGLASLLILGVFNRLNISEADGYDYVHGLVEATKQAFYIRNNYVTDPSYMPSPATDFLSPERIAEMVGRIDMQRASDWHLRAANGDTVWMGACDSSGLMVSFIQSIYWEFGSGVVLRESGVTWQNRGTSFTLEDGSLQQLEPGRKPFHTLNPAMAEFSDGRRVVYGTMGGDGQPQTQATLFTRYANYRQDLQQAISSPRWVLGRRWGDDNTKLKIEQGFDPSVYDALLKAGHDIDVVSPMSELMGHAGGIVLHPGGLIEGASDPRSDGRAACL
ncbi:MAG: gamma-glutamyltransferase family protein [Hyphomicrobiales bacterium]|nr:gamma-glutamyltransferase family protein [Hyphomicrobiales bacterium]